MEADHTPWKAGRLVLYYHCSFIDNDSNSQEDFISNDTNTADTSSL